MDMAQSAHSCDFCKDIYLHSAPKDRFNTRGHVLPSRTAEILLVGNSECPFLLMLLIGLVVSGQLEDDELLVYSDVKIEVLFITRVDNAYDVAARILSDEETRHEEGYGSEMAERLCAQTCQVVTTPGLGAPNKYTIP